MARDRDEDDSGDEVDSEDQVAPAYDDDDDDPAPLGRGRGQYDDDDEEEERPKKKKRRGAPLNLIDEEAEEDDDGDDDYDDEEYGGVKGLIADGSDDDGGGGAYDGGAEAIRAQRLQRQKASAGESVADITKRIEERYATQREYDDGDAGGDGQLDSGGVDQQGLQPTIRDPRLYILRCRKPGYERRAVFTLLQKMFDLRKGDRKIPLTILSAVAPDHLKGYIYVEAFGTAAVKAAVQGLDLITVGQGLKALTLDEMTDVLQIGKKVDRQERGNWVRMTRGMHKGDLAQVYSVPDGNSDSHVMVRMIPRLRYKREDGADDEYDDDDDEEYEDVKWDKDPSKALGKGRKQSLVLKRPPQKLFDPREASRLYCPSGDNRTFNNRDQFTGEVFDTWDNGQLYRLGLLYKKVSIRALQIGDAVVPTADELERWSAAETRIRLLAKSRETANMVDAQDLKEGLFLKEAAAKSKQKIAIFKGDTVSIVRGEQSGMTGTVTGFDGALVLVEEAKTKVAVRAPRADVVKTYKVGDPVRVMSGRYAGSAGVIVKVDGDSLVVFTDPECEEIKVTAQHVSDSGALATVGPVSVTAGGKQIELFQMVFPLQNRDAKGVVVGRHGERVSVLDSSNLLTEYSTRDLKHVSQNMQAQAMDARGNRLSRNIALHVLSGPYKDRSGVIVEVADNVVFFKASDETRNCGILAVPADQCAAQAAAARTLDKTDTYRAPNRKGVISSLDGGGGGILGGAAMRSRRGNNRDPLAGRDVKITKGPYKGHLGKVVDTNEKTVRVELTSKMKTVTLGRAKVKDVTVGPNGADGVAPSSGGLAGYQSTTAAGGPNYNSGANQDGPTVPTIRTPINFGGRTPVNAASRTPAGLASYGGSRTPAHNTWANGGSATPAHSGGFGSGLTVPQTPGSDAFRPATPGHADDYGAAGSFGARETNSNPYANTGFMPTTPGTPAMGMPNTPAGGGYGGYGAHGNGMEPNTPVDPSLIPQTPLDGQYNMPQTPLMEPQTPQMHMEPSTPYGESVDTSAGMMPRTPEPSTPMPTTPAPDEPATPGPMESAGDVTVQGYKVLINVVVSLPKMQDRSAVVTDAAVDGSFINVKLVDDGSTAVLMGQGEFTPVQPTIEPGQPNLVKVLDDIHAGRVGKLTRMDYMDIQRENGTTDSVLHGNIDFGGGEVQVLDMSMAAKFQGSS